MDIHDARSRARLAPVEPMQLRVSNDGSQVALRRRPASTRRAPRPRRGRPCGHGRRQRHRVHQGRQAGSRRSSWPAWTSAATASMPDMATCRPGCSGVMRAWSRRRRGWTCKGLVLHGPAGRSSVAHVQGLFGFRGGAGGWDIRYAAADGAAARITLQGQGDARTLRGACAPPGPRRAAAAGGAGARSVRRDCRTGCWPPTLTAGWTQASLRWSAGQGLDQVDAAVQALRLAPVGTRPGMGPLSGQPVTATARR